MQRNLCKMAKTRAATRRNQLQLLSLPEELLACVLDQLGVAGLARAAAVCKQLRALVAVVAEARWRESLHHDDAEAAQHPSVMCALWTNERLVASAGDKYVRCSLAAPLLAYRVEWPFLNQAQQMMQIDAAKRAGEIDFDVAPPSRSYFDSGPGRIEVQAQLGLFATSIQWAVDNIGFSRELATAYTLLFNHTRGAVGAVMRGKTPIPWKIVFPGKDDIASAHLMSRALRTAAVRAWANAPSSCPPPAYANLEGEWSLVSCDPAWRVLLLGGHGHGHGHGRGRRVGVGHSFVTSAVTGADVANGDTFPDGSGIHVPITYDDGADGFTRFELQDGPVVEFVSRPPDRRGFHALVRTAEVAYDLPPFATVTLEAVLEPGRWRANGKRVQQRCFRVSVTYG